MFLDGRIFMDHQNYGGEIGFMKVSDSNLQEADGRTGTYSFPDNKFLKLIIWKTIAITVCLSAYAEWGSTAYAVT